MNTHKFVLTTVFCILISFPFVGYYSYKGSNNAKMLKSENRRITQYQELKSLRNKQLRNYFANLDRYISDRLWKKDEVVLGVNRFWMDPRFFTAVDYSKGVLGKDGFVFLGDKYEKVISRHFVDYATVSKSNHSVAIGLHTRLAKVSKSIGAEYYLFVAPDKHAIYCEKIPNWLNSNPCGSARVVTDAIVEELIRGGIKTVYPYDDLRKRMGESVYYKTDTHWNHLGASIGFRHLIEQINASRGSNEGVLTLSANYSLEKVPNKNIGDLGAILGLGKSFDVDDVAYMISAEEMVQWSERGQNFSSINATQAVAKGYQSSWYGQMENPQAPNKLKVLILCDSFMTAMSPFFNINFSDIYYSSKHRPFKEIEKIMIDFKPNLIVYETVERALK